MAYTTAKYSNRKDMEKEYMLHQRAEYMKVIGIMTESMGEVMKDMKPAQVMLVNIKMGSLMVMVSSSGVELMKSMKDSFKKD